MDILQPLSLDDLPLLRDVFKRDWPVYAQYYYWINNAIKWKTKNYQYPLQIYCPNKTYDSGVFIGIISTSLYIVVVATFEESKDLLQKALVETNVIDWNQEILFTAVHEYVKGTLMNYLNEMQERKIIEITSEDVTDYYFKPKEECANLSINVPRDCELKHLDSSHVELIHSVWPHRNKEQPEVTMKYLGSFIEYNRAVGLFLKEDDSLASWVMHTDWGALGMLQTVEAQKRKGYGKIVVQATAKELAVEENLDSILFVVVGNVASQRLFASLGYKKFTTATWIGVKPILK